MHTKIKFSSSILIAVVFTLIAFTPAFAGGSPGGYCEEILGGKWVGPDIFSGKCVFRKTVSACTSVDLPRTIQNSALQPISFKGNTLVESASLSVPGGEILPILGLTYDAGSHTWSGYVNTLYLPAGHYTPVRVLVAGGDPGTRACYFGGLTVE